MSDRKPNGRFARGNAGGPGRPRRAIEVEYLAALSDAVSLDDWRKVCQAAVKAAKEGDAKARDWLTKYLIGEKPLSLTDVAADEAALLDADQDILEAIARRHRARAYDQRYESESLGVARQILRARSERGN